MANGQWTLSSRHDPRKHMTNNLSHITRRGGPRRVRRGGSAQGGLRSLRVRRVPLRPHACARAAAAAGARPSCAARARCASP